MAENWPPPPSPEVPTMNYALWADRVLAALADGGIAVLVMLVLYVLLFVLGSAGTLLVGAGESAATGGQAAGGLSSLICSSSCCLFFILPPVSYFVAGLLNKVYLVSKRGYSVGQGLMKLKVVDAHGNLIPMGTAVLRLLCTVGLGFVPVVGSFLDLLWPLWDKERQTLHDKAVGTYVVKTG